MTDAEKAKVLTDAKNRLVAADKEYCRTIRETYPIGSYVRWSERPYVKSGLVVGYSLTGHSVRVQGGKTVHVEAILLAALEDS